ncbi:Calmodulin-lysine N-methyltransferase [Dichanthelium oligosanthes]|uniref:Calmodulin-lysine N-methyltransferase n=1 Tax=Dichanthelium oligosanthes TaxID=888268 RepID=A0A1E5WAZ9_9POAL|nr:Calmodulin-lysine N-methyltransferase [Dichanthelium oligosanthes]
MDSSSPPSSSPAPPQAPARSRGASNASQRWSILRRTLIARSSSSRASEGTSSDQQIEDGINNISRKASRGFNLIECHSLPISQLVKSLGNSINGNENDLGCQKDFFPIFFFPDMIGNCFLASKPCCWPSEEVLAYYCINHSDMFRFVVICELRDLLHMAKRVLELGSGYGLAGLVIAVCTNADQVVISDGNPQVVGYIQKNISINAEAFGETKVESMILHWDKEQASEILNTFDIIVASDCTFFKQFHESLARTVKSLLKHSATSQAIFLSPKRGDSLDKFLGTVKENGLNCELIENYDPTVWNLHKKYVAGDDRTWPNYDKEHCYPLLVRISSFSE